MSDIETHSTGPRTEEGKQRSSRNSLKHGLFARTILVPGESREEFDRHLAGYREEYKPETPTEDDLVRLLAETVWRRNRIPALESCAMETAIESGDTGCKFLQTYGIYEQRLNRTFQTTLKTLQTLQADRRKRDALDFRIAAIVHKHHKAKNIPWNPADDGFVFSIDFIDRKLALFRRITESNRDPSVTLEPHEFDLFMARRTA